MPGVRSIWLGTLRAIRGRWRGRRAPPTSDALGRRGEDVAAKALKRAGYRIIARRLRTRGGEVDLVAVDGETLVLVEVKASIGTGRRESRAPIDRVDHAKRRRLVRAARSFASGALADRPRRIDVVAVVFDERGATSTITRGAVPLSRRRS